MIAIVRRTDADISFQGRKIFYRERSLSDQDLLRVFTALESYFKFEALKVYVGDNNEAIDRLSIIKDQAL